MRKCGCGNNIPKYVVIEGKKRNLQNRSLCLSCSPFGKGNTRPYSRINQPIYRKRINGKLPPYNQWSDAAKKDNQRALKKRRKERKQKLVDIKGGKCQMCGYDKCLRVLTFHHRDPKLKKFNLDQRHLAAINIDILLEEIEKCDLLCMNCHAEIEDKIANPD